jgi:hypothetical protein
MTFEEIVDQALAMLQRRGRVAYRTLKRQFNLDDEALEDLKVELIEAQRVAADEDGNVPPRPSAPRAPTRRPISPRRSSPPAALWKGNASRSRCCSPTSRTRPS